MSNDPNPLELVLASVVLIIMALGYAARRYPHVIWLRNFDLRARLTEQQQRRLQRTANVNTGAQMILLGIALPIGYVALKAMFLSTFTVTGVVLVAAGSLLCIITGAVAIRKSVRQ